MKQKQHSPATAADAASSSRSVIPLGSIIAPLRGGAVALVLALGLLALIGRDGAGNRGLYSVVALHRWHQQQQQQQQQLPTRTRRDMAMTDLGFPDEAKEECDCFRHSDSVACCQRAVIRDHKFGWLLTERLFKPFGPAHIERRGISPEAFPPNPFQDYRHAAIVRNFPEALVSGYLYHKSGRECWLTFNGWKRSDEKILDWDPYLNRTTHLYDLAPHPPRNGRSICRYVADEAEEVGMKVYVGVALEWWYNGLHDYYRLAKEAQVRGETQRTLFLCIEQYPDAPRQERMFYEIMDWLYPGGHNFTVPPKVITNDPDHGGHATSHNATERVRLLELVRRLDREVFRNAISTIDSHFGCPATIRRTR
jgi:hypothetical protein